jgi:hypothetical protein
MKQAGQEDVYVAVPEASGYDQTFAVDYPGVGRDFDGGDWSQGGKTAVVDQDRGVLDGSFGRRGVDFRTD